MIGKKKVLAIIPARGGSERIPKKNILNLSGKPLISWTIEAALASEYIDDVVVSTDDNEILTIAKKYGAKVPFIRPDKFSSNDASSISVVLHAIEFFQKVDERYDYIVLLQPTSPLRTVKNIDESIELLQQKKCDAIVSVCNVDHSPLWCNTIPSSGSLSNFLDEQVLNSRSQDLESYFRLNGAIYLCKIERILNEKTFFIKDNIYSYKMNRENSIDIDEMIDFNIAEMLMSNRCREVKTTRDL